MIDVPKTLAALERAMTYASNHLSGSDYYYLRALSAALGQATEAANVFVRTGPDTMQYVAGPLLLLPADATAEEVTPTHPKIPPQGNPQGGGTLL